MLEWGLRVRVRGAAGARSHVQIVRRTYGDPNDPSVAAIKSECPSVLSLTICLPASDLLHPRSEIPSVLRVVAEL